MASGKVIPVDQVTKKAVTHTRGSKTQASVLNYEYNPYTRYGALCGKITTNAALSADADTVLLKITDSLHPWPISSDTPIVVALSNNNQHRLHRGYINSSFELVFNDSQAISGPVVLHFYVPLALTY